MSNSLDLPLTFWHRPRANLRAAGFVPGTAVGLEA